MKLLFSAEEEAAIREQIRQAERDTTGEIRIYIESKCEVPADERTLYLFEKYKLYNTLQRNAVLLYIAVHSRVFYVLGDEGIHKVAGHEIWDTVKKDIGVAFSEGRYLEGLCTAIEHIGNRLKIFFPVTSPNTHNELPDDILYPDETGPDDAAHD